MVKPIQSFLKPRHGRIQQGYYKPVNPHKYIGDISQIIYRSSYEFKFLRFMDESPSVLRYASEAVAIPYYNPIDKKQKTYYIDFYMEQRLANGTVQKILIEVKPGKHTELPERPKNESIKSLQNYMDQVKRVIMNIAKFNAANNFAKHHDMLFYVIDIDRITNQFKFVEWEQKAIEYNELYR